MYYILCNVCKCIHICSMVIVFLQFRLGGLTKTRCWAIWPCTELDPGTKVIVIIVVIVFIFPQATTHAVFLGSFLLLASTPSEFISSIMSFPWPCTVGMINYIWPSPWWSSINIFNNCRSGERQQQGFWVIGILLTIADWWRETHRPGGTSTNPTRLWSASMSTILIPAPVLDLWGVLEFKVFSTNNFKGSVKQGNLSLGWRLSIGKPLLTNPN